MSTNREGTRMPGGIAARTGAHAPWTITPEDVTSDVAAGLFRDYYTEVSDRWYQREHGHDTDPAELEREIAADAGDGLVPPSGILLVAWYDGEPAGMAGARLGDPATAELKRVYLRPAFRGRGGAARLVGAAEDAARGLGARRIVLDTRNDLVEARTLYARLGYAETEAYNDAPYAEHWFSKDL
ncbi:GNAT family N-acetyltransferase [Myceligenerans xiligouense]|uniref:Acetyltransferase (GNAT) family protein n=1 Tax=Myceligenerans xiligouense TaxID=253184 RepID=A0A3N4ZJC8_9MICO|nr:GNAT family N-acetyltransferase [Myceligenerans xiligouense]RPF21005.1 acetyltransferase (GNAT) family protein [Myceligenerans xiligouense]